MQRLAGLDPVRLMIFLVEFLEDGLGRVETELAWTAR